MSADPHDEIRELISRTALSDRTAFAMLYDRTAAKLFGVALRILGNRHDTEDAVQEIYIKVWQRAASFEATGASPMSWLIAIARNHANDRLRSRRVAHEDVSGNETVADDAPTPEAHAIAAGERERIDHCLGELPEDRSSAVQAAYLDGASYQELAERFSVPLNTMRTWLRRSLIQLRECLES